MSNEKKVCEICKRRFEREVGSRQITCNRKCGSKLASQKRTGSTWQWSKNKVKDKAKEKMKDQIKEAEKHRQTIFVGGYDDGTFVTADEGELI